MVLPSLILKRYDVRTQHSVIVTKTVNCQYSVIYRAYNNGGPCPSPTFVLAVEQKINFPKVLNKKGFKNCTTFTDSHHGSSSCFINHKCFIEYLHFCNTIPAHLSQHRLVVLIKQKQGGIKVHRTLSSIHPRKYLLFGLQF